MVKDTGVEVVKDMSTESLLSLTIKK